MSLRTRTILIILALAFCHLAGQFDKQLKNLHSSEPNEPTELTESLEVDSDSESSEGSHNRSAQHWADVEFVLPIRLQALNSLRDSSGHQRQMLLLDEPERAPPFLS